MINIRQCLKKKQFHIDELQNQYSYLTNDHLLDDLHKHKIFTLKK
jgi:hypothetical protein